MKTQLYLWVEACPKTTPIYMPGHTGNGSTIMAQVSTIWHAIHWLFLHRQYAGIGIALAEYAVKSSISRLSDTQRKLYAEWLKILGFDIERVGLSDIIKPLYADIMQKFNNGWGGSSSGGTAVTSSQFIEHLAQDPHETLTAALQSTIPPPQNKHIVDIIFHLIERVKVRPPPPSSPPLLLL